MMRLNNQGFGLIVFLTFLPILCGIILAVHFAIGFIQFELRQNHICRQGFIVTQTQVGKLLKQLLDLNTPAEILRMQKSKAQAELALATAQKNPVGIARATQKLIDIQRKQEVLDQRQRQLIQISNQSLSLGFSKTASLLRRDQADFQPSLKPLLKMQYQLLPGTSARLAVRPDVPELAPVYYPVPAFKDTQALAHNWQYRWVIADYLQSFLRGSFVFQKECSVTLEKRNLEWVAKIHKGKSWPKSHW